MADMIALIKELREITGAGMMDCKKALLESNMDLKAAQEWLKEKGVLKAAKKADRVAAEGLSLVYASADGASMLLVEVNCETDFVSRGEPFRALVDETARILLAKNPASLEEALSLTMDLFTDATVKIGEKLSLRRFALLSKTSNQQFGQYVHMNGVVSSIVVVEGGDATFAEQLAMHITDRNPEYVSLDAIDPTLIAEEKAKQQALVAADEKLAGKPANILEKIVEGKVNTLFKEKSLDAQPFMMSETEEPVKNVLAKHKAKVVQFARFKVGEGIEKKVVDFASEVEAQLKNTR
jgi:elongation factor Ts